MGWIIAGPIIGALSDHLRRRRMPLTIASFIAFIMVSIAFYVPLALWELNLVMFTFGLACGAHPLCFSLSKENNPHRLAGTAVATTNTLIMLGGVIFQPLVGLLLVWHASGIIENGMPVYNTHDYIWGMSIIPIALLLSSILCLFLRETYGRDTEGESIVTQDLAC